MSCGVLENADHYSKLSFSGCDERLARETNYCCAKSHKNIISSLKVTVTVKHGSSLVSNKCPALHQGRLLLKPRDQSKMECS